MSIIDFANLLHKILTNGTSIYYEKEETNVYNNICLL